MAGTVVHISLCSSIVNDLDIVRVGNGVQALVIYKKGVYLYRL